MAQDNYNIFRFIEAKERIYPIALQSYRKDGNALTGCGLLYPRLMGLGHSYNAMFYGISGAEEAAEYLEDQILGQRLREASNAILNLPTDNAVEWFRSIDSRKL